MMVFDIGKVLNTLSIAFIWRAVNLVLIAQVDSRPT